jgi:hypothetical protein
MNDGRLNPNSLIVANGLRGEALQEELAAYLRIRQGHLSKMKRGKSATTNPDDTVAGGALLPLGADRERGGHKGYALAMMDDILSCVLSGAN